MEIGKYITLGHGIQVRISKNEEATFYHNFRDYRKKVVRKKLFTKPKYIEKDFLEAIVEIKKEEEIKKERLKIFKETGQPHYIDKNDKTLNDLSFTYFDKRKVKMIAKLKQEYNYLKNEDFFDNKIIKRKLANLKSETQKYNKNISKSKIANKPIKTITRNDVIRFVDFELNEKNLSQKSVSILISLIKTIVNSAMFDNQVDMNPFQHIQVQNKKKSRVRFLNTDELKLLLDTCKEYESNFNIYLTVYLGILTASRARAVLDIQKKDINIKNKEIRLSNFKSSKHYSIKLNDKAVEWLDRKVLRHIGANDYLIQPTHQKDRKNPQQPLSEIPDKIYEIMDELFNKDLDKSNNNDRDFVVNFHTIRRSVATNLALQGSNIYDIMTLLNHSSTKQTEDYLSLNNISLSTETDKFLSSIFD